jgi:hypothetical protein
VALLVDSTGAETPVPAESLGFTRSPQVWSDTSYVVWVARRWPPVPDSDTTTVSRFRVRCVDQTAWSGVVTVRGPRPVVVAAPPPPSPDPAPDPADQPMGWQPRHGVLRTLSGTPLGPGPALAVELPAPAAVRLDLFDLSGRRVRTLADRTLPSGVTVLPWDGRDEAGHALPRGVYFARLSGPGLSAGVRVPLLPR